jgi:peptidyl-prolyl cis-trans isomerase C
MRPRKCLFALLALALAGAPAAAQPGAGSPPAAAGDPTIATVNGQAITESALRRCLRLQHVPPAREAEARPALLEFLIDNALIGQYLDQLKVKVEAKEVDARVETIRAELKKEEKKLEDELKQLLFTEAEFRTQVEFDLRWEKFTTEQSPDDKLQKFFESNRETFDGTRVRARHILITPATADAKAAEGAVARLRQLKKQAEDAADAALAKAPANADAFTKKQTHNEALEKAFADLARENSGCPSKVAGGDVGEFQRTHGMVEPFARAAFALEPYQVSDPVQTQFGYHLILVTERKPGREVKFEQAKAQVKEVYADRLRDAVVAAMRPRAKIDISH